MVDWLNRLNDWSTSLPSQIMNRHSATFKNHLLVAYLIHKLVILAVSLMSWQFRGFSNHSSLNFSCLDITLSLLQLYHHHLRICVATIIFWTSSQGSHFTMMISWLYHCTPIPTMTGFSSWRLPQILHYFSFCNYKTERQSEILDDWHTWMVYSIHSVKRILYNKKRQKHQTQWP